MPLQLFESTLTAVAVSSLYSFLYRPSTFEKDTRYRKNWLNLIVSGVASDTKILFNTVTFQYKPIARHVEEKTGEIQDEAKDKKREILHWWNKKIPEANNIDKVAEQSVYGWGENAQEFGRELSHEKDLFRPGEPSRPQRTLDEIKKIRNKGWFSFDGPEQEESIAKGTVRGLEGWGENAAQFANDEYEDVKWQILHSRNRAKENVDSALNNLNKYKDEKKEEARHWWNFGLSKKDKAYENASNEYHDAKRNFEEWNNEAQKSFWHNTDKTARKTQEVLDSAHGAVNDKLGQLRDYSKDNK
ncbi:hypothetical protein KAFR_0J01750 [Kazachstania africana CBS 2517]|uniref:Uncharacterized protein n=1 Tax=Kazachstania africana (strain ATCC 22294 / BCRC 22015 / CBS 2517 / CECT 1963 / NBRC 1671 / NRRL Y-8276) TaxID=1071382 RepID=H2B0T9_KAZAF|nr:hypothetical protein KAFR_0J01750 [Kazachstania africana CBS 2517]CCF60239.1 hypothetical protein KAFR_0J01750 [Kazachstania africana CBS 2517]